MIPTLLTCFFFGGRGPQIPKGWGCLMFLFAICLELVSVSKFGSGCKADGTSFLHGQDVCSQVGANQRMKTFGCLFSRSRSMFITILIYNDLMIYMNLSTCISFFHEMNWNEAFTPTQAFISIIINSCWLQGCEHFLLWMLRASFVPCPNLGCGRVKGYSYEIADLCAEVPVRRLDSNNEPEAFCPMSCGRIAALEVIKYWYL